MYEFRSTSPESGGDTSSSGSFARLVDDPDNYAKELPVRNSRNPKPQYKVATVYEPMPKTTRSRPQARVAVGRGTKRARKITPRRRDVISRFLNECSQTPGKYGRVGSLNWYCELTNQINTPGSGKKITLGEPVSNAEVMNWLDLPGLAEAYENLKANETQQQQPAPCSSGKAANDKEPSAPLPPNKRLRPNPKSYLETTPVILRSENGTKGLLPTTTARVQENKSSGDEETSVCVSITSSFSTDRGPDEEPSTARHPPEKSAACPGPVTIIERNLSADELRAQAATIVEQLVVPSLANVKQEIIVEEAEVIVEQAEMVVEQAEMVVEQAEVMENEAGISQRKPEQGTNPTDCDKDKANVQQKENPCQDSVNTNGNQANLPFPYESLGVLIQQEVRADRDQGLEPVSEAVGMSEEEEAQATVQVLRSLHNAIDKVRHEFVRLTNLRFHRRAPVAMSVLGFVVDSLVSFVANYLNPVEPVEY